MNNKWKSLLFFSPAVCVALFAAFGLLCNQPIFPSLSGNAPAGNLEKVADAKEKKQSEVKKKTAKKISIIICKYCFRRYPNSFYFTRVNYSVQK